MYVRMIALVVTFCSGGGLRKWLGLVAALLVVGSLWGMTGIQAEESLMSAEEVRTLYPAEWGVEHPGGLAYSATHNHFFLLDKADSTQSSSAGTNLVVFTPFDDLVNTVELPVAVADAANIAYDDTARRLLLLNAALTGLIQVRASQEGVPDPATITSIAIEEVGLSSARGMAVDRAGGFLYILDSAASQVVRITLPAESNQVQFTTIELASEVDAARLHGLAYNPTNDHLYAMHPAQQLLYELDENGQLLAQYDLSALGLTAPSTVVFAPSGDLTDEPQKLHLFIGDSRLAGSQDDPLSLPYQLFMAIVAVVQGGEAETSEGAAAPFGRIVEATLDRTVAADVISPESVLLTLVRTIQTSTFTPPSPDPSGIDFIPTTGVFLISDGEVDEMSIFAGVNIFEVEVPSPNQVLHSATSLPFSNEPVGIAFDHVNNRVFISDDDKKKVFEINPGNDGALYTGDDVLTSISTAAFDCMDPEGLDYEPSSGDLFISDGLNNEVYRVSPGVNGIFDGVPAAGGDDVVTQFDTVIDPANPVLLDPESVFFNPATGNLILVSNHTEELMYEFTTAGALVRTYDISAANADNPSGVVMAPGSVDPGLLSFYIIDRMEDNDDDPNENDGLIYEFAPPPTLGNGDMIYVSSTSGGKVGGVRFEDEDVLVYDTDEGEWTLYFDGSDVGLDVLDIDAFSRLDDGSLLLSLTAEGNVGALGLVDDSDIVRFIPSSLGPNTAGTFEWYFDGSDVELTENAENIDALALLNDGRLVLSTSGNVNVTGVSAKDEDLLVFTPTQLGETTSGDWSLYFDGSDVGLSEASSEEINGTWVDPVNGDVYLTTLGAFSVAGLSGDAANIFTCAPVSLGLDTACTYRLFWSGSAHGFAGEVIDGFDIDTGAEEDPTPTPTDTPGPTATPTPTPTATNTPDDPPQSGDMIFVSSTSGGTAGNVPFADEDVLVYDTDTAAWAIYFDGSDVGLKSLDLDVFHRLNDGSLLLSFTADSNVGTLGLVDESDIVRFIPSAIGPDTAGTFEWYFDGSDVELTEAGEDVDALALLSDGRLVLSTVGNPTVTGVSAIKDEDLLLFTPTQLGETTSGAWALYFNGTNVGLNTSSSEDINGAWIDPANGDIYLSTVGVFSVAGLNGDADDIFVCTPLSLGANTSCDFHAYWDGAAHGFAGEVIDALFLDKGAQQVSSEDVLALRAIAHTGEGDDPLADPNEGPDDVPDDVDEPDDDHHIFLPWIGRE